MNYISKFEERQETGEILEDYSSTKKSRPWRSSKRKSLAVAKAMHIAGYNKISEAIGNCGERLVFKACPNGHEKHLHSAFFCKKRMCPMCQWRRSLKMFSQVLTLANEHMTRRKTDVPLLLTLTVPNCKSHELNSVISDMTKGWNNFLKRRELKNGLGKSIFTSWFRALEVSYNPKRDDFHPHFHILLMVPRRYFDDRKKGGYYLGRDDYLRLWRDAMNNQNITQVDIRKVKGRTKAIAEVAKYSTKQSSYINYNPDLDKYWCVSQVVIALHEGIYKKRLVGFGGLFKDIRKELNLEDVESNNTDLVNTSEHKKGCNCSVCGSDLEEEIYKWKIGFSDYIG